jgi:two-component sensor histidine kinase
MEWSGKCLSRLIHWKGRNGWNSAVVLFAVNSAIALILMLFGIGPSFGNIWLTSNAIGFSVWWLGCVGKRLAPTWLSGWRVLLLAPVGIYFGIRFSAFLLGNEPPQLTISGLAARWRLIAGSGLIAVAASVFIALFYRALAYRTEVKAGELRAAEAQRAEMAVRLALLQAQIEPHFLFNTLAHISSLIDIDGSRAKSTLEHLNRYLRVSLHRTKKLDSTLAEEISLIETILAIAHVRLGDRLRFSIEIPTALRQHSLAPLLLQPLVENALEHGIEPSIHGGEIRVSGWLEEGCIKLSVADTGMGLKNYNEEGIGLSNVRSRLKNLYGAGAKLQLFKQMPQGFIAQITLPLPAAPTEANHTIIDL